MSITSDIIVGFPGETDEDFEQTLSLIEEIEFNWGFIFKYSAREGTPAAKMESFPEELIEERHRRCLELVDLTFELVARFLAFVRFAEGAL